MKKDIVIHTFKEKKPCYGSACFVRTKTGDLYTSWFDGVDKWEEWNGHGGFEVDDEDRWVSAHDLLPLNEYCKDQDIDDLKAEIEALCNRINDLEKRMTPPASDPLTLYTPYPVTTINTYFPWPTTASPDDPIIYSTTCSVS